MKDSKSFIIGMLCLVVVVMAVAYAAFSTTLNINGTATISSTWNVAIKQGSITCTTTPVQGANPGSVTASGEGKGLTADFTMSFAQPGDTAECSFVVENKGSLKALLETINIIGNEATGPILFTVSGVNQGDKLAATTGTHTLKVKGEFDPSVTGDPASGDKVKDLIVSLVYKQDLS